MMEQRQPCLSPLNGSGDRPLSRRNRAWRRSIRSLQIGLGSGVLAMLAGSSPAWAAEEIRALFGPVQASIPVRSIEAYVNEGHIDSDLATYIKYLEPQQWEELKNFLGTPIDIDLVPMTNFLYTDPGEFLLGRIGSVIRTRKQNGLFALRAALILAASEEGGLTPLNVLKYFPTPSLVIDFEEGLSAAQEVEKLITQSSEAIALIKQQFQSDVDADPLTSLPGSNRSTYGWEQTSAGVPLRRRAFPFDIYVPKRDAPAPIVVISHGLGSNRDSYRYLATHLVSHGFAVVVPEHQGSNADHIQALLTGASDQVAEADEFFNRASDITMVLNWLEQLSKVDPQLENRLDFDSIGVIGQSFGGYTALALAGATFDFENLADWCPTDQRTDTDQLYRSLNLSLILQCRALDLQDNPVLQTRSLRDSRVDAIIAINPIGSAIFGPEGFQQIDVPVMIMTGSADVVAPTLWEQLYPFSWLQTPEKFLLVMHQGTHFSTIGATEDDVALPEAILGPAPHLAQRYVQNMSLAFFQNYLNEQASGQYLSPTFVQQMSRDRMPLSFIRELDINQIQ